MADLETLKALMLRAQGAKEADRALDEAIMAAFYVRDRRYIGAHDYYTDERVEDDVWVDPRTDKFVTNQAFRFTEEAGAVERLIGFLPGGYRIGTSTPDPTRRGTDAEAWAKISPWNGNDAGWRVGPRDCHAPTVPLALTAAALMLHVSALLAQAEAPSTSAKDA